MFAGSIPRSITWINDLGSSPSQDWTTEVVAYINIKGPVNFEGVWGEALGRLVEPSGGPDGEAATWPTSGAPLGIVR